MWPHLSRPGTQLTKQSLLGFLPCGPRAEQRRGHSWYPLNRCIDSLDKKVNLELAEAASSGLHRMRGTDRAAFCWSMLLAQDATAFYLFPGWGTLEFWHALSVCCGIQSLAGDGRLDKKQLLGEGKAFL